MARTIAITNQAGGVGKTTLVRDIGYELASRDKRVLLIDLDPQASLTIFLGLDPWQQEKTIYHSLKDESVSLPSLEVFNLKLVPSNLKLAEIEMELATVLLREFRLREILNPISDNYDFILIDCPPSLGLIVINALCAADEVLIPIQCEFKSWMGTDGLFDTIAKVAKQANKRLKILGVIPTMLDSRTSLHTKIADQIRTQLGQVTQVFPPIRRTIACADASVKSLPIQLYDPKAEIVNDIKRIVEAIL
ncbi:MAG: ParA family protein [Acidobacteria bacterium]|nr:ParA family protein [Acidobacteriota bacterium]